MWRVYSTVVDDYITDDMSFEELKDFRRREAIERADEETMSLLTERPSVNFCKQSEADYWSGRVNASDGLSDPQGGIPNEEEF